MRAPASRWLLLVTVLALAVGGALLLGPAGWDPGIVWDLRAPRVLLGVLVGAALAVAGVIFQALLRNDLAEPYLVGVGPGAALGVTLAAWLAGAQALPSAATRSLAAFLGAVGVAVLVFAGARRAGRTSAATLVLSGVALGLLVQALATGMLYVAVPRWDLVMQWLLGHLVGSAWLDALPVGSALLLGLCVAAWRARELDALTLGEDAAWLVGVDARRTLLWLGAVGCLLAATAVATAGLVGFVGLVVPHLARRVVGAGHRSLLPASALLGGALLVLADALARVLCPPLEIPPGLVTAAVGAPVLLVLLLRRA
ncbi:MAG: FecCD family ABC transporter permease [Planctomycetia bacterium]